MFKLTQFINKISNQGNVDQTDPNIYPISINTLENNLPNISSKNLAILKRLQTRQEQLNSCIISNHSTNPLLSELSTLIDNIHPNSNHLSNKEHAKFSI